MRRARKLVPVSALALAVLAGSTAAVLHDHDHRAGEPLAGAQTREHGGSRSAPGSSLVPAAPAGVLSAPAQAAATSSARTRPDPSATGSVVAADRPVVRERPVTVTTAALPYSAAAAAVGTDLELFPGTVAHAALQPAELTGQGYQVWRGTVTGSPTSSVVLVESHGVLAGTVVDPALGSYRIHRDRTGQSVVEQLDISRFPDGPDQADLPTAAPAVAADATPAGTPRAATGATGPVAASGAGTSTIDIAVGYSTAAKTAYGSQAAALADIALAVEQTNTAFIDSGINARLRLAGTVEVPDDGDITDATLSRAAAPHDGWNDALPALRERTAADVVSLLLNNPGRTACGMGYLLPDAPGHDSAAYDVVDRSCATGNFSFTHELGHVLGAAHDRGAWAGTPAHSFGYDWVNPAARWRTVMAYTNACSGCTRLLRFSNPDQLWQASRLGSPVGAADEADNRANLNLTVPRASAYRTTSPVDATLTANGPSGTVTVPARTGSPLTWTWTGNVGSTVRIELLRGSTPVRTLAASAALSTGSYLWTPAGTLEPGPDYRLRVTALEHPEIAATTVAFPVAAPQLTPAPLPAAGWLIGRPQRITWSYTGLPTGTARVELLRSGQVAAVLAAAAPLGSNGTGGATVTPPASLATGSDYQLRTVLNSYADSAAATTLPVSYLGAGALTVTSPNGGETWRIGTVATTTWTAAADLPGDVKVELLRTGPAAGPALLLGTAPADAGALRWTMPVTVASGDVQVRLTSSVSTAIADSSDAPFHLLGASVTATSEAGPLIPGAARTLTWTSSGVTDGTVKVELVAAPGTSGAPLLVSAAAPVMAGAVSYVPPATLPAGARYRLKLTLAANVKVIGLGLADLTVTPPTLRLTTPTGPVPLGAPVELSWQLGSGASLPVTLTLTLGRAVTTIASGLRSSESGSGTYRWTPPLTGLPGTYGLRASAAPTTFAVSDLELVRPTLTLTAPVVVAGSPSTVTWSYSAALAVPVRLELLRGGVPLTVLATAAPTSAGPGAGSFTWPVPAGLAGGDYQLRARPASPALTEQTVDVHVTGPGLVLTDPVGTWTLGAPQTVNWAASGGLGGALRLELVPPTGSPTVVVPSVAATAGQVSFVPPLTLRPDLHYRVRAVAVGSLNVTATSSEVGMRLPTVTGSTSAAAGPWDLGTTGTIRWNLDGGATVPVTVTLVRGASAAPVGNGVTSSDGSGSLPWTPPLTTAGGDAVLRVSVNRAVFGEVPVQLRVPTVALTVTGPSDAATPAGPDGVSSVSAGQKVTLTWAYSVPLTVPVQVDLMQGTRVAGAALRAPTPAGGTGTGLWTVAPTLADGDYQLRITPQSPGLRPVLVPVHVNAPAATVTTPTGWTRGAPASVDWAVRFWSGPVRVELLRGTTVASVIATAAAPAVDGSGQTTWTVPANLPAGTYTVRVSLIGASSATSRPFTL